MRISTILPALLLTLLCAFPTGAQTAGPNPGVTPVRQIDRAEVRVTRVELQPGAVRNVHQHDDVRLQMVFSDSGISGGPQDENRTSQELAPWSH
jgi:hypothetical protein